MKPRQGELNRWQENKEVVFNRNTSVVFNKKDPPPFN